VSASPAGVLLLVRHAEPTIDRAVPASRWNLSPGGRRAAARIASSLASFHPGACFSSPEPKALQTAEALAPSLGLDVVAPEAFREHDRSEVPFFDEPDAADGAVDAIAFDPGG